MFRATSRQRFSCSDTGDEAQDAPLKASNDIKDKVANDLKIQSPCSKVINSYFRTCYGIQSSIILMFFKCIRKKHPKAHPNKVLRK